MMSVKCITFKNGMTVLGEVSYNGTENVIIKQPVQIGVQQTPQGPGIGFAPFLDFTDEFDHGIPFKSEDVLCSTSPVRDLYNKYNEIFGSGIQVVSTLPKK